MKLKITITEYKGTLDDFKVVTDIVYLEEDKCIPLLNNFLREGDADAFFVNLIEVVGNEKMHWSPAFSGYIDWELVPDDEEWVNEECAIDD